MARGTSGDRGRLSAEPHQGSGARLQTPVVMIEDRLPGWEAGRQIAPRAAGTQHVDDGISHRGPLRGSACTVRTHAHAASERLLG